MANSTRVLVLSLFLAVSIFASARLDEDGSEDIPSAVLTLDASNFHETIAKHPFIVVEFFAPWCGHCKKLEPEYEKAATLLNEHDPPIVLAKVDANDEINKELASTYEVSGFPTLKILRNEGKSVRDYKGPRDADGIVEYLKREVGPASIEIISSDGTANLVESKKISIIGIFPEYSGEEFDNFTVVAEKLRSDYYFGHSSDAKLLPLGDTSVNGPIIRLFKPFDELFVEFQDFHVEALENFIEVASTPIVTTFDKDPLNHPFVMKFFNNQNAKAMLYINFSEQHFESFKSKFYEVAEIYKGKKISFLVGDLEASQGAFKFFGLSEDQVPLLFLQEIDGKKFLKPNLESDEISTWIKEYTDGKLTPFIKSEPIPESNDEGVKVVVAKSLKEMVLDSHKNVLLEFYAPWCGHCKKLAPILDEVALSFKDDAAVLIAKMDATANDVPVEFEVKGYPTLYFSPASGEKLLQYDGPRTADDIIDFINSNKDAAADVISESAVDSLKDEL